MITHAPLTPEQQRISQYYNNLFSLVNGAAYVCLGDNVIILLAVRMEQSNFVVSVLGAMVYFGYLLLPLGKMMSVRSGGVGCQANFWAIRNIAGLFIATSVPLYLNGHHTLTSIFLLTGMFVFYGSRAAGIAVAQPLIGEITSPHTLAKFLTINAALFYLTSFLGLSCIISVLYFLGNNNIWVLTGIVVFGSILGVISSGFLRKMYESGKICEIAKEPALPGIKKLLKDSVFLRYAFAGMVINLEVILLSPISLLTLKRGYGISNTNALLFSVLMLATCTIVSKFTDRPMRAIGPRRYAAIMFMIMLIAGVLWVLAPEQFNLAYSCIIFIVLGIGVSAGFSAMNMYFLQTIEESKRVVASILNAVLTGVCSGLLGIFISGVLFKSIEHFTANSSSPMHLFRLYFLFATVILSFGVLLILRMKPLPIELRYSWKPKKLFHLK